MNKEFVDYKTALALKELGFDEECLTSYHYDGTLMDIWSAMRFVTNSSLKDPKNFNAYSNSKLLKDYLDNPFTATPTFSQAFRWFREKHGMHHGIGFNGSWYYDIDSMKNCDEGVYEVAHKWDMETYEEAEQACLDKLIEICKNK